jgi:SPP1 gp7 family putative phage head morphogenesis protein
MAPATTTPTIHGQLYDRTVSHGIYVERYKAGAVDRVVAELDAADAAFYAALQRAVPGLLRPRRTIRGYADVRERLQKLLRKRRELLRPVRKQIRREALDFVSYEITFQHRLIEDAVATVAGRSVAEALGLRLANAKEARLRTLSEPISLGQGATRLTDRLKHFVQGDLERVGSAILAGLADPRPKTDILRRVRGTPSRAFVDGAFHRTRVAVNEHVRTAVAHGAGISRDATQQANAKVIPKYRFVAVLDGRTSDICISYSGQVFVNGKGPIPPLHHQCRSTTCPVFDILEAADRVTIPTVTETRPDWKRELDFLAEAKRTGRSVKQIRRAWAKRVFGEVPSETTYAAWLKTQPKAFQDEVLGRTRGIWFRQGKLDLQRFVDHSGNRYTIEQLAKRDGLMIPAFKPNRPRKTWRPESQ